MSASRPLVVLAPGSLASVREAVVAGFAADQPGAAVVFGPPAYSGLLAQRILEGAEADLFVSADPVSMAPLVEAGLVPEPCDLAGNRLGLLLRPGFADALAAADPLAAIAADGIRLLLPPAETDPLGRYAAACFARAGLTEAIARKRARGEVGDDLPNLAARFRDGTLDAALIYATSAPQLAEVARFRPLPPDRDLHDQIRFVAGVVRRPGLPPHPAADALLTWLTTGPGQSVLRDAGFEVVKS